MMTGKPMHGITGRIDENGQLVDIQEIPLTELPEITFVVVPEKKGRLTDFWCRGGEGHEDDDYMTMDDEINEHGVLCKKCRGVRQIG